MAVIGNTLPTLVDWANHLDPNGAYAATVEGLRKENEILDDMVFIEGNLPTGHETTYRTELPEIELVGYNEGVTPSKSAKGKIRETCATLMGFSEVDKRLADLASKKAEFLASEDEGFVQSFNDRMAAILMHGNAQNPKSIDGLLTRYSPAYPFRPDDTYLKKEVQEHIIDAGGSGDRCASVLLVGWGKDTVTGMFPKGSKAGFNKVEMGLQTITGENGKKFVGYQTQYFWDFGLVVRDPRFIVRVMNIDTEQLTKDAKSGADLLDLLVVATETIQSLSSCRPVFYCSRPMRTWMRRQFMNKANLLLNLDTIAGRQVLTFDGIPVRRVDAMNKPEVAE
ncbi:MAG: hypothetical protein LIP77_01740 [Planctomycetes bacterium]|nr:hypothetical protein [Planctomycetota bacterium]